MPQLNMKAAIYLLTPVSGSLQLGENIACGYTNAHTTQPVSPAEFFLTEIWFLFFFSGEKFRFRFTVFTFFPLTGAQIKASDRSDAERVCIQLLILKLYSLLAFCLLYFVIRTRD